MTRLSPRGTAVAWVMTLLITAGMTVVAPARAATSDPAAGPARASASSAAPAWRSWYSSSAIGVMWSVAAFSTKSIWAGGTIVSRNRPIVVRWNGSDWARVIVPGASRFSEYLLAGSSARNVWVFGIRSKGPEKAFRWDGAHWHAIAMPVASVTVPVVVSARSVWITGQVNCDIPSKPTAWKCVTPVYRWNGHRWRRSSIGEWVTSLATARGAVMAAGVVPRDGNMNGPIEAFRWTGARWAAMSMPHPRGAVPNIGMDSASDVWISSAEPNVAKDYELHWNGHTWSTIRVTPNVAQTVAPAQVVPDGHGGAWLGGWARYTGGEWVAVGYAVPPTTGHEIGTTALTPVPGASHTYVESAYVGKFGGPYHPAVYVNGPLP